MRFIITEAGEKIKPRRPGAGMCNENLSILFFIVLDPLLKRLTNERYFETYLRESTEGPPRKYYHITAAGVLYRDRLEQEWDEFQKQVCRFLKEQKDE